MFIIKMPEKIQNLCLEFDRNEWEIINVDTDKIFQFYIDQNWSITQFRDIGYDVKNYCKVFEKFWTQDEIDEKFIVFYFDR